MVRNKPGYIVYLHNVRKLAESTSNSYPTYLESISRYLNIEVSPLTIQDAASVVSILDSLKAQRIDSEYWSNCQSALRAYLDFLKYLAVGLNDSELELLAYLIDHFQKGTVKPGFPETYLPYSQVVKDLQIPSDERTPGESLNKHAMGGLAVWLLANNLPAITGVIINKLNNIERGGCPSKGYFEFHQRNDLDFTWLKNQLKKACGLDWKAELSSRGLVLDSDLVSAEEVPETLKEGAKKTIVVNSYERSSSARNACIAKYGTSCVVCKFSFDKIYGSRGKGFIHVHHLVAIADIGEEYEIDPIEHLRPVCPNCHAMLHSKGNISIETLQGEMSFRAVLNKDAN